MICTGAHKTLKEPTEIYSMSSDQLDCGIDEKDIIYLAGLFDNAENYLSAMGLTYAEQMDIRKEIVHAGTQMAMTRCLLLWKQNNPSAATLRTLLQILLRLGKEEIASKVSQYYFPKHK